MDRIVHELNILYGDGCIYKYNKVEACRKYFFYTETIVLIIYPIRDIQPSKLHHIQRFLPLSGFACKKMDERYVA